MYLGTANLPSKFGSHQPLDPDLYKVFAGSFNTAKDMAFFHNLSYICRNTDSIFININFYQRVPLDKKVPIKF